MNAPTILQHASNRKSGKPVPYRYNECGLDNVWLIGGFYIEEVDNEECLFVEDQDDLHKAIGLSIIDSGDRITGRELRFLRNELNISQEYLSHLLDADVQSVARWEKGKAKTPGPADRLIRFLYLQKLKEDRNVLELLETLAQLDRLTHEREFFERTPSGWRKAA